MIDRIVLDVELLKSQPFGEAVGTHQRRVPGVEPGTRFASDRKQLAKAPHVPRALVYAAPRHRLTRARVVVHDFQWPQTLIADPQRLGREFGPAQMALQP